MSITKSACLVVGLTIIWPAFVIAAIVVATITTAIIATVSFVIELF